MQSAVNIVEDLRGLEGADDAYIWRALQSANMNALRIALYHETNDPELTNMPVDHVPVQGGALTAHSLPKKYHEIIREKAFAYLKSGALPRDPPTKKEAAELMTLFTGYPPTEGEINFGYEDLAFQEFSRDAKWTNARPDAADDFSVTIIGAGFSGIAAAIQLDRLGIKYRIIERMGDISGTWELNDYPEARVDVSNFLYQYKFVKNYPWKSYFAPRDEIKEYANFIVDTFNLRPHISLNTTLKAATWNEATKMWELDVDGPDGVQERIVSNLIFSCAGLFSTPNLPEIEGIETFEGKMFHTTQWDHGYDYRDKNIALIGTGSTGSQLLPALAAKGANVTVYQRTPQWVMPIKGYHARVTPEKHWLLRNFPGYWNWFVYSNYIGSMQVQQVQDIDPEWEAKGGQVNEKNALLRQRLTEFINHELASRPDLLVKMVPQYPPMGRRLVIDNAFYKTLLKDNVELVTDGIKGIDQNGIETNDGTKRRHDLIVLSAGFKVSQYLWPVSYTGSKGVTLENAWAKDGARAYLSITMPDFPNFFMYYGPTGQVRGGSFHSWIEVTTRYVCGLVIEMIERGANTVEVKRQSFQEYNDLMDSLYPKMLWTRNDGGLGYFFNEHGRVITNMPFGTDYFYSRVEKADPENFNFE